MFERFGEFDSYEEINRAVEAQKEEGDFEAVKAIAVENGLDPEDAEDFCTGAIEELATPTLAALGKLDIEAKELKLDGIADDWKGHIAQLCIENEELALAVRKKGKNLKNCMGELLKFAFHEKRRLNDEIVRAAGLTPPIYMGIPGKADVERIAKSYYLGAEK